MTSGTFRSLELDSISVDRIRRQRKELSQASIEELGESMRRSGLIHPILVQRESHELIAGERRFLAAKYLGWTHIMVQYEDEVDPVELKVLELEENTRRKDLTWQEECLAIAEYHAIMLQRDPDWSQANTATALRRDEPSVFEKLKVAQQIQAGNNIIAEAQKYSTARGIVRRAESRKTDQAMAQIIRVEQAPEEPEEEPIILNLKFQNWWPSYTGPRFNFIHCDFPYGIGADTRDQGVSKERFGVYSDTPDDYFGLLEQLINSIPTIAQESCHLMFWFSMKFYRETLAAFSRSDFTFDLFPLIWTKSDNVGLLPDPERGPRRVYETALFGSRGDRKIVRATGNSISCPSVRDSHMSEKSQTALEHFFRMFVDGSTSILDPTAGSGSALRAARILGAARLKGLEMNEDFARRANERLK